MILTLTLNPSVDISYPLDELHIDTVNRIQNVSKTAGGKGLNVTRVLSQLNEQVVATGFLGGKIGDFIAEKLNHNQVKHSFSKLKVKLGIVLLYCIMATKQRFWSKDQQ